MLTNKFRDTLMKEEIIVQGDKILVAFSGGIDSVALLNLLLEVRESFGLRLGAAHLNHGYRENADADEAFCRSFCEEKEVPFFSRKMDVEAYAKAEKVSFEMAGRTLRYAFFEEVMKEKGFSKCATAHHLDDQVETVFLNLMRGTGLKGLTGISPLRGRYVRPLLSYKKSELLAYLERNQISFRHDHTNDEVEYQRNRLRNEVLPYLEKHFNADVSESISRMTGLLVEDLKFIEGEVEKAKELLRACPAMDFVVICSNIGSFKMINDIYGNQEGNALLCSLAARLRDMRLVHAVYGRLESDKFAICMSAAEYHASGFAQIYTRVSLPRHRAMSIMNYIGVYAVDDRTLPIGIMCDRAMMALNTLKGSYEKQVAYYDESLRQEILREQKIVQGLQQALQEQHFELYLQPQVDVRSGRFWGRRPWCDGTIPCGGWFRRGSSFLYWKRMG